MQQEKDEHYIRAVVAMCASAEEVIKENNAIDIYEQYWEGETEGYATEAASPHTLTQLLDPSPSRRGAQYICWHPDGSRRVCLSLCNPLVAQPWHAQCVCLVFLLQIS